MLSKSHIPTDYLSEGLELHTTDKMNIYLIRSTCTQKEYINDSLIRVY